MTSPAHKVPSTSTPLAEAIGYAAAGWPVFPVHTIRSGACACRSAYCSSPGKHPITRTGLKEATTDLRQVRRWWGRWPDANIGICTGIQSKLVVLDVDPDHGGIASLSALIKEHESLPKTLTVSTGSDGLHFYFSHAGDDIRNSAGRLGPGLDIRGEGGYVIAPPSRHLSGKPYFVVADLPVQLLPDWLIEVARVQVQERVQLPPVPATPAADRWATRAFINEVRAVESAAEGTRNATLNRAAFNLGQIVGSGGLHELDVTTALIAAGMNVGLSESECCVTVTSGLRAGVAKPRCRPATERALEVGVAQ